MHAPADLTQNEVAPTSSANASGGPNVGYRIAKRAFDMVMSVLALVALSPLLILLALWVKLDSSGPVLYRGERVGIGGKPFRINKFRTMVANADRIGGPSTADDDPRITRSGHALRKFKLDEIPQLFNVLVGEMSFVGPRPQVAWDVARYTPTERALLTVRPGMTDWASIRFHNEGEILKGHADPDAAYDALIRPEKIRLGLEYVRKASFTTDLKIIFETLRALIVTRAN